MASVITSILFNSKYEDLQDPRLKELTDLVRNFIAAFGEFALYALLLDKWLAKTIGWKQFTSFKQKIIEMLERTNLEVIKI